jgi:hypothetical protein
LRPDEYTPGALGFGANIGWVRPGAPGLTGGAGLTGGTGNGWVGSGTARRRLVGAGLTGSPGARRPDGAGMPAAPAGWPAG